MNDNAEDRQRYLRARADHLEAERALAALPATTPGEKRALAELACEVAEQKALGAQVEYAQAVHLHLILTNGPARALHLEAARLQKAAGLALAVVNHLQAAYEEVRQIAAIGIVTSHSAAGFLSEAEAIVTDDAIATLAGYADILAAAAMAKSAEMSKLIDQHLEGELPQ